MNIALFPGQSRRQWADTMINLEARKLCEYRKYRRGHAPQ